MNQTLASILFQFFSSLRSNKLLIHLWTWLFIFFLWEWWFSFSTIFKHFYFLSTYAHQDLESIQPPKLTPDIQEWIIVAIDKLGWMQGSGEIYFGNWRKQISKTTEISSLKPTGKLPQFFSIAYTNWIRLTSFWNVWRVTGGVSDQEQLLIALKHCPFC